MKAKKLKFNKIVGIHDSAKAASHSIALTTRLIHKKNSFTEEQVDILLMNKPMVVVSNPTGYKLISGFREWQLALSTYDEGSQSKDVTVLVHNDRSTSSIENIAWSDAVSLMLHYSILPSDAGLQLSNVLNVLPKWLKPSLFNGLSNKQQMADATGLARTSFYPSSNRLRQTSFLYHDIFVGGDE